MSIENHEYFKTLQVQIEEVYKEAFPDCTTPIRDWKGKEIARFQHHLEEMVHGRISEKSFYTYFKQNHNKIPRVDILDILCQYTGKKDWQDFLFHIKKGEELTPKVEQQKTKRPNPPIRSRWEILIVFGSVLIGSILLLMALGISKQEFIFCFVDADFETPIKDHPIEVKILQKEESPKLIRGDKNGCIKYSSKNEKIKFVVHCAYYKSDTIIRRLSPNTTLEMIQLKRDDYAWMIQLFSKNKLDDWKKRRQQLEKMIANEAEIFQVDELGNGMEMYNKSEFVNKLTLPIESLKNIEILESTYKNEQIIYLRFK